ncbi:MAG TPA: PLP-dependent aminotransferase family protein [Dongiaceae bacterium]
MTIWIPDLSSQRGPRYLAIADALASDIRSSRLSPGDRLPTHRELAYQLGVTVGTVTRAYGEAERRGLIGGEVGRGTFVRSDIAVRTTARTTAPVPGAIATNSTQSNVIEFSINTPTDLDAGGEYAGLMNATLRALSDSAGAGGLLNYQVHGGNRTHREAGAQLLAQYGVRVDPDRVLITAGAQHAVMVALGALTEPGDTVLTESLTWPGLRRMGDFLRFRVQGLPMDRDGILPDAFEAACRGRNIKALYCVTNLQNPTSIVVPELRRRELAEVARRYGVKIVEDDVYGFLVPDAPPPMVNFAPELGVFCTSVSKSMAPGLRVGYLGAMVDDSALINDVVRHSTWLATPLAAEIAARWIGNGEGERISTKRRDEYGRRQAAAREILAGLPYYAHPTAMHGWLDLPDEWPADAFALQVRIRGVAVCPTSSFSLSRSGRNGVRISISAPGSIDTVARGLDIVARLAREKPRVDFSIV